MSLTVGLQPCFRICFKFSRRKSVTHCSTSFFSHTFVSVCGNVSTGWLSLRFQLGLNQMQWARQTLVKRITKRNLKHSLEERDRPVDHGLRINRWVLCSRKISPSQCSVSLWPNPSCHLSSLNPGYDVQNAFDIYCQFAKYGFSQSTEALII